MRRLGIFLAALALTSAAPGRLANDHQTRNAVDDYASWRDRQRANVEQTVDDLGQETEDLRQQFEDIQQQFADYGQQLEPIAQQQELGQQTITFGQELEDVDKVVQQQRTSTTPQPRRVTTPSSTTPAVPVAKVSLSEEERDDQQIVVQPAVTTQRPRQNLTRPAQVVASTTQKPRVTTPKISRVQSVQQIVQESAIESLDLVAGQQVEKVTISEEVVQKPQRLEHVSEKPRQAARGDQVSVSGEVDTLGQQSEKFSLSGEQVAEQQLVMPTPKPTSAGRGVSVFDEDLRQVVQTPTCKDGILIGSVCYQSWDDEDDKPVPTTARPQSSTSRRPQQVATTPTLATTSTTTTTVKPGLYRSATTTPTRATVRTSTTTTTTRKPTTTSERAPARLSVSSEEKDDQTQVVQQQTQQIRQNSGEAGQYQVKDSSEEMGQQVYQKPTVAELRLSSTTPKPSRMSSSSEETGQIYYKPDYQIAAEKVSQSSEEGGQVYQKPEKFEQQVLQVTSTTKKPTATSTTAKPVQVTRPTPRNRLISQLQEPVVEGSEELHRISSYIGEKVNQDYDSDDAGGQQTVQTEWQNLRELARVVDGRAGQQQSYQGGGVKG